MTIPGNDRAARAASSLPPKSTYGKRRRYLIATGRWQGRVPAAVIQEHIADVRAATGMTIVQFAALAGINDSWLADIIRGDQDHVYPSTARRILAVTARSTPPSPGIRNATGSTRRLRALTVTGWLISEIAEASGLTEDTLRRVRRGDYRTVQAVTADKVTAAYDLMWNARPPARSQSQQAGATRAQRYAARQKWVPGGAWDDIDDPACRPLGARRLLAG
jgi:transcriptional regulator with XRE-family HTH domain